VEYTGQASAAQSAQRIEQIKEEAVEALSELRFARIGAGASGAAAYPWLLETVEGVEELLRSVPSRHRYEVLSEAGASEVGGVAWLAFAGAGGRELGVASDRKGNVYAGVRQGGRLLLHGTPGRAVSHLVTGRIPQEPRATRREEETPRGRVAPGSETAAAPDDLKDRVARAVVARIKTRLLALGGVSEEESLLTALAANGVGRSLVRKVVEDLRAAGELLRLRTPRGNAFLALGSPGESEGARELVAQEARKAVVRAEARLLRDEATCRGARRGKTFAGEAAGDRPTDDLPQPSAEAALERAFAEFCSAKARAGTAGSGRKALSPRDAARDVLRELRFGNAVTIADLARLMGGNAEAARRVAAKLEERGYVRLDRAGRTTFLKLAGEHREKIYRPGPSSGGRPAAGYTGRRLAPHEAERVAWDTAEAFYCSKLPSAAHRILHKLRREGGWLPLREVLEGAMPAFADENPYGDPEKGLRREIRSLKEAGKVRVALNRRDGREYVRATQVLEGEAMRRHEGELLAIMADPRHGIPVPPGTKLARRVAGFRIAVERRRAQGEARQLQPELAPAA
jgi:DNA-binding transcriptional ArsR family regulator